MNRITIREPSGKFRGSIEVDSRGYKTARDRAGKFLGTYDPKQDVTKNTSGKVIARGDILVSLIP